MNLDDQPILEAYLIGCVLAFILHLVVVAETYIVTWFVKGNVLRKNLNKLKDPAGQGFKMAAATFALLLFIGTIASWLAVLQYVFQIFWTPIQVIREALSSIPEEIKLIRFPLMNNPNLSREAVWAYQYALGVKAGAIPNATQMAWELEEIGDYYPSFNHEVALRTLRSLGGVDHETISEVLARMRNAEGDEEAF